MSIHEQLNLLGQAAERQIPSLNYGGCCVFAAEVGKVLKAKGIPVRGVARGWMEATEPLHKIKEAINNLENADEWNDQGVNFSHVGLQVKLGRKWYVFDSNGCDPDATRLNGRHLYPGHLSVEDIDKLASNPENWNKAFRRKTGIPAIKRLVREYLEE